MYRPWGDTSWLLNRLGIEGYSVFGCIAPEARSATSLIGLRNKAKHFSLARVRDIEPADLRAETEKIDESFAVFSHGCGVANTVWEYPVNTPLDSIDDIIEEVIAQGENVLLDISSLPKRWFFYATKALLNDARVKNLLVTYTPGDQYAEVLSENPEILRALPGFTAIEDQPDYEYAFIGIGYQNLAMFPLFGERPLKRVHMLFPFPPGPPGLLKNWEFVEQIEREVATDSRRTENETRIVYNQLSGMDVSQAFDAMVKITDGGKQSSVLAPYGPKPMSLAMCLFSAAADGAGVRDVPAYYTQPKRYSLDYTKGVRSTGRGIESWTYAVKLNSRNLYGM